MKYDELEVGMKVRDHWGNEYKVVKLSLSRAVGYNVRLECTKHVQTVHADCATDFRAVGDTWWIQRERGKLLNDEDPSIQAILKAMNYSTLGGLPVDLCTVDKDGVERTFYVWPAAKFKYFELTLNELYPIPKVEAVAPTVAVASTDGLKLGMRLQRADGTYIVLGFDDQHVYLGAVVDATTCDGVTHKAAMCTQIPVEAPKGTLSLKDFMVVED